jgi:endonuclease G
VQVAAGAASWTIPLVVTVQPGAPVMTAPAAAEPGEDEALTEKLAEPWRDENYQYRQGYDPNFLEIEVPLPTPRQPEALATLADGGYEIPYCHFSLAMHRGRRLALYTACNVRDDEAVRNPDPTRKTTRRALSGLGETDQEKWFTDPRLRGLEQLPDKFFTKDRKAFDKGHLVRRDDVAWGETYEELRIANGDTYHVTNCSPQTAGFNRANGVANWGELEKAVLAQASDQRLSVFAGPILRDDDPVFAGVDDDGRIAVKIPQSYWKVVVAPDDEGGIAAFGFLLEQDLSGVDWERLGFEPKWAAQTLPLDELERKIGHLTFPQALHDADRYGSEAVEGVAAAAGIAAPARPARTDAPAPAPAEGESVTEVHIEPQA